MIPILHGHNSRLEDVVGVVTPDPSGGMLVSMAEGRELYPNWIQRVFGNVSYKVVEERDGKISKFLIVQWGFE